MLATHQWCQMSMKFIKKRNLGEIKKNGRREGDLHLLLQEVTYLAWVAIIPEKGKDINKKKTQQSDGKEKDKVLPLKFNLK